MPDQYRCFLCGAEESSHWHIVTPATEQTLRPHYPETAFPSSGRICCAHFKPQHSRRLRGSIDDVVLKEQPRIDTYGLSPENAHLRKFRSDSPSRKPAALSRFAKLPRPQLGKRFRALKRINALPKAVKTMSPFDAYLNFLKKDSKHQAQRQFTGISELASFIDNLRSYALRPCTFPQFSRDIILTLHWLRKGTSKADLSLMTGHVERTVNGALARGIEVLLAWATERVKLLDIPDWINRCKNTEWWTGFKDHLVYMVDSTNVKILQPTDPLMQQETYNTHYHQNAWSFWVLVTPDGHICHVSGVEGAKIKDGTAWNESSICSDLEKKYPLQNRNTTWTHLKFVIGGDKAYKSINMPPSWRLMTTLTAKRMGDESATQVKDEEDGAVWTRPPVRKAYGEVPSDGTQVTVIHTEKLAAHRAVVERVFAAMKDWLILDAREWLFWNMDRVSSIITIIAALTNEYRSRI